MRDKILIVDGSNLLFQMFFGMPARIYNADGVGIWGVLGFVGALLKIIRQVEPTHVAVLFDGENPNPRAELDADYKANRPDFSDVSAEENPYSQLPHIYRALDFLRIAHAETTACEVDDWIAGCAARFGGENEVVISSFDSDFFQLISGNVSVFRYRGKQSYICDGDYLREKFGVTPGQYAGFKALTGDSADNIRGAEKVGPKTARALLEQFGTLENLIANASSIGRPSVRASIQASAERLMRNYRLIRLNGRTPAPFALEEMRFVDTGIATTAVLRGIGL